ncbi:tRNA dihydrouridine synthase [Caminibacter pacificus]|uniref:tRNA-dihydrouridine synthase n=1 Tax=Caminibacter pacificus TaxID=1424653 RepID=A0AAJ4RBB2_9BACT|nr:tRNA-dihydrouridine synthase family protein [Caminibacter pacificus]QCI27436.1 tRNA-dihydrouridine synthase family protein [Caminibacter pacificus]ROR38873.1 tRNA-dihydrouridine synthase B [Caminibacter pacificus]
MSTSTHKSAKYFLAPLAGYTDLPFRSVVKKFGCDMTFSEMINVNAIAYNNEKTKKMMQKSPLETPYFIQVAANNVENAIKAVEIINEMEEVDGIDINLGCPVNKARRSGFGGVLLKDENKEKLKEIVSAIVKTSKKPVSAKMRLGFDEIVAVDRAKMLEDLGIEFLTVHGRTVKQMYKGQANYEEIKKVVEAVNIPVIANGDITDYEKAKFVLEYTGAVGVAIGRGAIGKPWIFLEMKQQGDITPQQKKEVILEHFDQMIYWYGEYGVILFRKHAHAYSKGIAKASEFRSKINEVKDAKTARELIEEYF